MFSGLQSGKGRKNIVMNGEKKKVDNYLVGKCELFIKNTDNDLLSHKCVHILLLVSTR